MVVQRIVVSFARGNKLKYISHLDMMRLWVRALTRAGIPVAYSEGFSPHPRIALAAPLAVGVTSDAELLDLYLESRVSLRHLFLELSKVLPDGINVFEAREVPLLAPSLQARNRFASYRVEVEMTMTEEQLGNSIRRVIEAQSLPRQRIRDGKVRSYDLRPLIRELSLEIQTNRPMPGTAILTMTLRQDNSAAGRPEEVTAELGFSEPPLSVHRTGLELDE